jgi:hypothetical protein
LRSSISYANVPDCSRGAVPSGYRVGILEHAVEPLKRTLGPKGTERLIMPLAMVYGIDPYVIWEDIFGANDRKVETIARWMAQALVDAGLRVARDASSSAQTQTPRARVKSAQSRGNGTRTAR